MNYNKEDNLAAIEFLKAKKWGKFLLAVPPGAARGYNLKKEDANYVQIIRIRASQMSKDENCDRVFAVSYTVETEVLTITATLKNGKTSADPSE